LEVLTQLPEHCCIGSGPHGEVQVLAWQTPEGQTCPQVPQLKGSVLLSTHWPLQTVWPGIPQTQVPVPAEEGMHLAMGGQTMPHPPQLFGSKVVSTQALPQRTLGGAHWQMLVRQIWPGMVQVVPQPPQLAGSLVVSTHLLPHSFWPETRQAQVLLLQAVPGTLQAWLQVPQLALLDFRSTQLLLQLVRVPQSSVQVPALQTWLTAQAWPHEPQFAWSLW
jgi:hypothetical protein